MKISFEGNYSDILDQMEALLRRSARIATAAPVPEAIVQEATVPEAIAPVDKPVKKPGTRTPKQLENDERLRAAARAKLAARKAPAPAPVEEPVEKVDPADIVKLRQRTIDDLQAAYANGHQQEVFELLSRFGDGAKSFRELKPEAFIPIREAIDSGALA